MRHALVNGSILIDGRFHAGKALLIEGDRIAAILPDADVPPMSRGATWAATGWCPASSIPR
ncbi:hypothetical protein ACFSUK_05930 [Sphingobium scionense]